MKKAFFILGLFGAAQLLGMEAPPTKPMQTVVQEASFDSLPGDVKRLIVPLIASSKITEVANTILALNRTNKFFHNFIQSPAGMISILERMPYIANAIDLVEVLKKTNLPVIKNPTITKWVIDAKGRLEYCAELQLAILNNDDASFWYYLKQRTVDLNCQAYSHGGTYSNPTPLVLAVLERRTKMVELLLAAGAIQNLKNLGKTPRTIAVERVYTEIVDMLDRDLVPPALNQEPEQDVAPLLPPIKKARCGE